MSPVLACEVPLSLSRTHDLIHVPTQDPRTDSKNAISQPIKGPLAVNKEVVSQLLSYLKLTLQDTFMC